MRGKRFLAWTLSLALLVGMLPGAAFAAQAGPPCENHPEHTGCSYVEGSPCGHTEHTAECYTGELICDFKDAEQIATDSEATESHEHGPECHALDCPHERGEHDGCGYVEAQPCDHECELCAPQDSGNQDETTSGQNVQKSLEPEFFNLGDVCNCQTPCSDEQPMNSECPVCSVTGADPTVCALKELNVNLRYYPQGLNGEEEMLYPDSDYTVTVGQSSVEVLATSYPAAITVTLTNPDGISGSTVTYSQAGIVKMGANGSRETVDALTVPYYPSTDTTKAGEWMTAWGDGLTVAYVPQEPTQQVCNCTVPCGETVNQDCPVCKEATTVADVCAVKVLSVSFALFPGAVSAGGGVAYDDGTSRTVTVGASGKTTFTLDNTTYPETITIDADIADGPQKGTYQRAGFLMVDEQETTLTAESVEVPAFPSTGGEAEKSAWDEKWGGGLRVAYVQQEAEPSEQFPALTPGGTYWFDLSGTGIGEGIMVNDALPDKKLHWVPFTYTGTITAYRVPDINTSSTTASDSAYPHSLFIADYNVINEVTWDELNTQGLIFGKSYSAGNVGYTLRAPSAGSLEKSGGNGGTPVNNEWDQIPIEYIKNYEGIYSWGQDIYATDVSSRAGRGYTSARFYGWPSSSIRNVYLGFRPVLEILSPDTLSSDSLQVVTVDLNGGSIGGFGQVNLVVAAGETNTFKAPSNVGIALPTYAERFLGWRGNNRDYQPGEDIGSEENTLTAMWEYKSGGAVSPGGDDDDDSSSTGNPISQPGSGTTIPIISGNGTTGSVTIKGGTNASATGIPARELEEHVGSLENSGVIGNLLNIYNAGQTKPGESGTYLVPGTESIDGIFGAEIKFQAGDGTNIQIEATFSPDGTVAAAVDAAVDAASKITANSTQTEILAVLGQLKATLQNNAVSPSGDEIYRLMNAAIDVIEIAGFNLHVPRDPEGNIEGYQLGDNIGDVMNEIANRGNTGNNIIVTPENIQIEATLNMDAILDAAEKITKDSPPTEMLMVLEQLYDLAKTPTSFDEAYEIWDAFTAICTTAGVRFIRPNLHQDGSIDGLVDIDTVMNEIANRGNTGDGIIVTPGKNTGTPYTVEEAYGVFHIKEGGGIDAYVGAPSAGTPGKDANGNTTDTVPLTIVTTVGGAIQKSGSMTITTAPNGTTYNALLEGVTENSPFILCRIQYLALSNPFTDVTTTDWFYQAVMELYSKGIMQGTSDTTFSPQGTVTRAQAAQVLYNMDGRPQAAPGGVTSDIPVDAWYADAAAWAMGRGIVQVTGDRFGGDDPVSREELVEMLYRYAKYKGWDVSVGENTNILSYKDFDQIGEEAVAAFQWACGAGIVQGDGNGYLHPQDGLTRAELAGMLQRALDKYKLPAAPVSPNTGERKARRYKVKKGDTLSGLAGRFHTTVAALVGANPIIKDPSFLLVGWELDIP